METTLIYSSREKKVFFVHGYDFHSKACSVIKDLSKGIAILKNVGIEESEVYTSVVRESSSHQNMRYFWASLEIPPKDATVLDENWTMGEYLRS